MTQAEKDAALDADPARALPRRGRALPALSPLSRQVRRRRGRLAVAGRRAAAAGVDVQAVSCSAPCRRRRSSASCTPPRPPASSRAGSSIDKTTAFRQARALVSILKEHIGNQRRPFLVLDAADSLTDGRQPHRPRRGHPRRGQLRLGNRLRHGPERRRRPGGKLGADRRLLRPASRRAGAGVRLHVRRLDAIRRWRPSAAARRSTRPRPFCCTPAAGRSSPPRPSRRTSSAAARRPCSAPIRAASSISTAWWSRWERSSSTARAATSTPRPSPT